MQQDVFGRELAHRADGEDGLELGGAGFVEQGDVQLEVALAAVAAAAIAADRGTAAPPVAVPAAAGSVGRHG
jgi:hypothetical protein